MNVRTLQNHLQPVSNHFKPAPTNPQASKLPPTIPNQPQTTSATPNHLQHPPVNPIQPQPPLASDLLNINSQYFEINLCPTTPCHRPFKQ